MKRMVYAGRHPFLICMYPVFFEKVLKKSFENDFVDK